MKANMPNLVQYQAIIEILPDTELKGNTMPYTSLHGHMFSFIDAKGNVGLRLNEPDRSEFMEQFQSIPMVQHGRTMKEYVVIPQELLQNTALLSPYFEKSIHYIKSLKPKNTKK